MNLCEAHILILSREAPTYQDDVTLRIHEYINLYGTALGCSACIM